jgi:hypothetical protein
MTDWDRESPSGTAVRDYGEPPIIDQDGVSWTITRNGQVVIDGNVDTRTHGVIEIQYINRRVWMWTDLRLWWYKTSPTTAWLPPDGTPYAPYGPFPDPRIDELRGAIDKLSAQVLQATGTLAAELDAIQAGVGHVGDQIKPDERIDALTGAMAALAIQVSSAQTEIDVRLDSYGNDIFDMLRADRAALSAAEETIAALAARQGAMAIQLDRIISLLLDHKPKGRIRIDTGHVTFTPQPAPANPGP